MRTSPMWVAHVALLERSHWQFAVSWESRGSLCFMCLPGQRGAAAGFQRASFAGMMKLEVLAFLRVKIVVQAQTSAVVTSSMQKLLTPTSWWLWAKARWNSFMGRGQFILQMNPKSDFTLKPSCASKFLGSMLKMKTGYLDSVGLQGALNLHFKLKIPTSESETAALKIPLWSKLPQVIGLRTNIRNKSCYLFQPFCACALHKSAWVLSLLASLVAQLTDKESEAPRG